MYLDFPSSWGSRPKAEQGQSLGTYESHAPEAVRLSLAMGSREEQRCWSVEGGLTTSCSEQYTFRRGEPQHFQRRICGCSAVLCLLAPSQLSKLVKHLLHCMCRGSMLEFVGTTCVLTHSPSFRQSFQTLTQYK